ncbi:MAG: peptidoglycan bridge formation glycyltransferase FemA/FemB family protein [Treponema sp.]|jgi:lipid II:glycine glycyltransferase (peptidoglycan interpeptide bridge formation enzyme)|nr:peptidoglycan bridge formation glycyltransferase FemA/FemB family protein [Treponema sp.]
MRIKKNDENTSLIKNITETKLEVCEKAGSFLQSAEWGKFKSRFGWKAKAFLIDWGQTSSTLLTLSRRLAPGFSFAYIPWGPELPEDFPEDCRNKVLAELAKKLKSFFPKTSVFLRIDPPWFTNDTDVPQNGSETVSLSGLKQAAATVQAPDTVIINLDIPPEEILAAMKPKWRYNISLSEKKNVTVKEAGAKGLETFYNLLRETAVRDGIAIHSFDYYKILFEIYGEPDGKKNHSTLRLYTACHDGLTLAAIVVLFRGKYATYLYGASSCVKRNLMASYALQWRAIKDAKEAGCQYYDLFGIPPDDNPNHPMAGLYRFKTGFGGQIIHRPGSLDYPYKPAFYNLFNLLEAIRKKLRDRKKRSFSN